MRAHPHTDAPMLRAFAQFVSLRSLKSEFLRVVYSLCMRCRVTCSQGEAVKGLFSQANVKKNKEKTVGQIFFLQSTDFSRFFVIKPLYGNCLLQP